MKVLMCCKYRDMFNVEWMNHCRNHDESSSYIPWNSTWVIEDLLSLLTFKPKLIKLGGP